MPLVWLLDWKEKEEKIEKAFEQISEGKQMIDHWVEHTVPEQNNKIQSMTQKQLDLKIQLDTFKGPYEILSKKLVEHQDAQEVPNEL